MYYVGDGMVDLTKELELCCVHLTRSEDVEKRANSAQKLFFSLLHSDSHILSCSTSNVIWSIECGIIFMLRWLLPMIVIGVCKVFFLNMHKRGDFFRFNNYHTFCYRSPTRAK